MADLASVRISVINCCANENCARHFREDESTSTYPEQFCTKACEESEKLRLMNNALVYQDEQDNRIRHYLGAL